nr:multiple PDZ domain protein-like isoform X1 [Dermatophagoides farinae]
MMTNTNNNNIVNDIKKLQDSLEKLYNTSSINFNGNVVGQQQSSTHQLLKDDIRILLDVLECPVFESILNVQYSLQQLREQFQQHPSILPVDVDIDTTTLELNLNLPNDDNNNISINQQQPQQQQLNKHHHQQHTHNNDNERGEAVIAVGGIGDHHNNQFDYDNRGGSGGGRDYCEPDYVNISLQDEAFRKGINELAQGRMIQTVELYKPEGKSLGFKVVGLNHPSSSSDSLFGNNGTTNNNSGSNSNGQQQQQQPPEQEKQQKGHHFDDMLNNNKKLGIYIQEIHENGIAARSGLLKPLDQILAIDRHLFTNDLSHEDAINILQSAKGVIRLIVARPNTNNSNNNNNDVIDDVKTSSISTTTTTTLPTTIIAQSTNSKQITTTLSDVKRSPSNASDSSSSNNSSIVNNNNNNCNNDNNMVLNTEWIQIDCIELDQENENGLGFGIVGGRSSGVIVKTIIPGGAAAKDNRLQIGDHILQINGVNMRGMSSDQVAQILRQTNGQHIKLIVARPVDPSLDLQVIQNTLTIVPTKSINDPIELEKQIHLLSIQQQQQQQCNQENINCFNQQSNDYNMIDVQQQQQHRHINDNNNNLKFSNNNNNNNNLVANVSDILISSTNDPKFQSDQMETFEVELIKDQQGLGITIAGYVCEKVAEEISGIFIKSIATGSVAERSKMIQINDQIIEVDKRSLYGYNNLQAVDLLRNTGKIVRLKLARYIKGSKYHDQIQQGVMNAEQQQQITAVAAATTTTTTTTVRGGPTVIQINSSNNNNNNNSTSPSMNLITSVPSSSTSSSLAHRSPNDLREKWSAIVGPDFDIIIASVTKFCHDGGLGISLEGVIDIENGNECRPHHYINSILSNGPVGRNGLLQKNDELLEVNGIRLHGLKHSDVLPLLKDLPIEVQLVCARPKPTTTISANNITTTINNKNPFVVQMPTTTTTTTQQSNIDIAKFNNTTISTTVGSGDDGGYPFHHHHHLIRSICNNIFIIIWIHHQ